MSTPGPMPSSPLLATLASLEESISREQRKQGFCCYLKNGFGATTSEVGNSWKAMIMQITRQEGV